MENDLETISRILVVEDEATFACNLAEYLSRKVADVRVALNAETAMREAQEFPPDVVLVDCALGASCGITVLDRIRELQPAVRALLMTAHPSDEVAAKADQLGVSTVLLKPFSFAELSAALTSSRPVSGRLQPLIERRVTDRRQCALAPTSPRRFLAGLLGREEKRQSRGRRSGDAAGSD